MLKHALYAATLSLLTFLPIAANANESVTSTSDQPKTMPYGDNPNIFRVLTYKTGQSISRLGNSIQRGADKSSAKISENGKKAKLMAQNSHKLHSKRPMKQRPTLNKNGSRPKMLWSVPTAVLFRLNKAA